MTTNRIPEEQLSMSIERLRHNAKWIYRARWILTAKVIATAKYGADTPEGAQEIERLQERFEGAIKSMSPWLRTERFLDKHVVMPATRRYLRVGILQSALDLRNLADTWRP